MEPMVGEDLAATTVDEDLAVPVGLVWRLAWPWLIPAMPAIPGMPAALLGVDLAEAAALVVVDFACGSATASAETARVRTERNFIVAL